MTKQYAVTFTRWLKDKGRRDISAQTHFRTEGFHAAVRFADAMLGGMREVDPEGDYEIAEVVATGLSGSPHRPTVGEIGIWPRRNPVEA